MSATAPEDLQRYLRDHFKLPDFRTGQRPVIETVLQGKDALAVMPTGGGKSLCYQFPSVCRDGIVLVISPLIALMEDQVRALQALGIAAGFVHSSQTLTDKRALFSQLQSHSRFVLYLSPERVQKAGFAEWARRQNFSLFAIDEAHCVSQWGPDFRKDYYRLNLLRQIRPDVPILALTATATPMVLKDISSQLQLKHPARHVYGFYRSNLYCQVESCDTDAVKLEWVRQALTATPVGRVLIYCGTRKQSEELVSALSADFDGMGFYHAGLSAEQRTAVQKDYEARRIRILAATNAFGMGIDHPDVRLVIHFQMPANIESYYQELGRAGRDGLPASGLLLYSKRDKGLHAYFIQQGESDAATTRRRWKALDTIVQFAEGAECRHSGILTYFRDSFRLKHCGHCDVCEPRSPRRVWIEPSIRPKTKESGKRFAMGPLTQEQSVRVEVLRAWRKAYAEEKDVPAFMVFSNKTLEDLARKNPATLSELENVYGFGEHKVEHLGPQILEQLALCDPA